MAQHSATRIPCNCARATNEVHGSAVSTRPRSHGRHSATWCDPGGKSRHPHCGAWALHPAPTVAFVPLCTRVRRANRVGAPPATVVALHTNRGGPRVLLRCPGAGTVGAVHKASGSLFTVSRNSAHRWALHAQTRTTSFLGHTQPITAVVVVVVKSHLCVVSTARDSTMRVWHPLSGKQLACAQMRDVRMHGNQAWACRHCAAMAAARDGSGRHLVAASSRHHSRHPSAAGSVDDLVAARLAAATPPPVPLAMAVLSGGCVTVAGTDGAVRVYEVGANGGLKLSCLGEGHTDWVVVLVSFGGEVYSASHDGAARAWSYDGTRPVADGHECQHVRCERVYGTDGNGRVGVSMSGGGGALTAMAVSGEFVVTGARDGLCRVFDRASAATLHNLAGHSDEVVAVVIMVADDVARGTCGGSCSNGSKCGPRSVRVATASQDTTVRVWDLLTGVCQHVCAGPYGHTRQVSTLTVADNRLITSSKYVPRGVSRVSAAVLTPRGSHTTGCPLYQS